MEESALNPLLARFEPLPVVNGDCVNTQLQYPRMLGQAKQG